MQYIQNLETHQRPDVILQWILRLIVRAGHDATLDVPPPVLSRCYQQMADGIVEINTAKKLTHVPFPFPFAQMITCMLMMHTVLTPFIAASILTSPHWAGLLAFVSNFVFWAINFISAEMEHPFGDDPNDLPLFEFMESFNFSLHTLTEESAKE